MKPVLIYTSATCGYCMRAKQLLQRKGVAFDEISVPLNMATRNY